MNAGEAIAKKRRSSLAGFVKTKTLRHDTWGRATALLGTFSCDAEGTALDVPVKAIAILHQEPFNVGSVCSPDASSADAAEPSLTLLDILQERDTLELTKDNAAYSYFKMRDVTASEKQSKAIAAMTDVRVDVIEPATWFDIRKYIAKQIVTLTETPALYETCTLPYLASIEKREAERCKWVHNILDGVAEQDCVLCQAEGEETGFVTVKSPNWKDGLHGNAFYLCLVRDVKLKSLRSLNSSHLPLLKALQAGVLAAMEEKHGLAPTDVHAYFHYQPSFFHLHVHFRAIGAAADPNVVTAREYPLSEVINNIEICSEYYQKRDLRFASIDHEELTAKFARVARDACEAPLLVVLGYARLETHFTAKDNNLKVFLEQFLFNHFHVALVAGESQKEKAREILGEALFEQLQWCDCELSAHQLSHRSFAGIVAIDVPAASISTEVSSRNNVGAITLPEHCASINSTSPAMDESVFSHGGKLRKLLWACLNADAAQIRRFIAIRDTYAAPVADV